VQSALAALGLMLSVLFVPAIAQTEYIEVSAPSFKHWAKVQWQIIARVAAMMCTPSVLLGVSPSIHFLSFLPSYSSTTHLLTSCCTGHRRRTPKL